LIARQTRLGLCPVASALCLLSSWACFFTSIFSFQTWSIRAVVDPLRASIHSSSLLRRVRSVLLGPRASLTSRTRGRGVQEGTWTMDPSQESRQAQPMTNLQLHH
ncbi:unnamed protein product, partial [Ectocarpus sp. 12 AP-2014]